MKIKKAIALMIGLVLIASMALPGTLAVSADQAAANSSLIVADGTEPSAPEGTEASTPEGTEASAPQGTEPSAPEGTEPSAPADGTEPTTMPTEPEAPAFDAQAVYDQFMATETLEEFNGLFDALSDEEVEIFCAWLTENGLTEALEAHLKAILPEEVLPETAVFTDAGPFLPAVRVVSDASFTAQTSRMAARAATNADEGDTDGLKLKKTAVANNDGTYTITPESYTTGSVTTTTMTKPADIVLVLDQSTSMCFSFSNNELNDWSGTNKDSRQYAMKQAVYNFIDNVKKQYSSGSDHRIAIVKFGDSASDVRGWTFVDDNGAASLKSGVQGMQIQKNTGTQAQTGMSRANELINTRYSYSGNNTDRQKVVILFTDGIPGDYDFNPDVADSAASFAKQIKDAGATVYTIGIFNGANVNEMYGSSTQFIHSSGGTIGSHWCYYESGSYYVNGITYAKRSSAVSAAAGNRFLNLVSSNFKNATMCGLGFYSERYGYRSFGYGWKITQNFTRSASNYYLTANDASSLNNIFQTISSNINTPSIELGSETVVRDVIADCFEIPENAAKINVYTAAATAAALNNPNAEASWQARTYDPTISAAVSQDGKTVSVSGFNYTDNFVAATGRGENADFYGKKLIIEFTVKARSGFLGGNDVETNASADVYENSSSGTPIKSFNKPTVNVPIKDVTVTVKDKNVYLKGKVTASDLKNDAAVKVGKVAFDLSKDNYGLESWQTKYVNITVEVKDKDGKAISDKLDNLTDDTKYTITVKVSPRNTTPTSTEGETAIEKTGSGSGKINVFKPELTFKDSTAHYGEAVPADFSTTNKVGSENWKHNSTEAVSGEMLGTKPELDVTYAPDGSKFANGTYTDQDVPVSVTVKIGDEVVNSYTTFVHQSCNPDCGWTVPEEKGNPAFLIHIQSCTLTITKTGWETIDENQSFIFKVVGPDNFEKTVAIYKGGSVTIKGLKIGTYTVTEVTGWSWRYTPDGNGKTITLQPAQTNEVTFANTRSNDKWLGGDAYSQNKFGS